MDWIKTDDRLPKIRIISSDYVLIFDVNYGIMIGYLALMGGEPYWTFKEDRSSQSIRPLEVTHWMPLPKEPQFKEDKND